MKMTSLVHGKKALPALFVGLFTASGFTPADDTCKNFYPMEEGKKFELTHYNPKDKAESRAEYEVIETSQTASSTTATIRMKGFDKKDKPAFDGDFQVTCEDGVFKVDIRSMLSTAQLEQLESMEDMEVSVESNDLEIPSAVEVGDQLKDGSINIAVKAAAGGMTMMNMTTTIKERKVTAREKMTTPAGAFDCMVITSVVDSKTGFMNFSYETKEWLAEDVGLVRSETYRKGKLEGYTLLTKME